MCYHIIQITSNDYELTDLTELLEKKEKERIKYINQRLYRDILITKYFFTSYQSFLFSIFYFLLSILVIGVFLGIFLFHLN